MINYRLLSITILFVGIFTATGLLRLDIDTDVVRSLPAGEKVIADGLDIFEHHPIHDQIAVDVAVSPPNPDILADCGLFLEQRMKESGLFSQVGMDDISDLVPQLAIHVAEHLPLLFSREELERKVAPLLEPDRINERINNLFTELSTMESIGQARFISADPLGLKNLVLAKMALLAPAPGARFHKGHLLSTDGRHLLVTARPLAGGTDTASARKISQLLQSSAETLVGEYGSRGTKVTLTPVGAYRAALDNEQIIRHDVRLALALATVGIALLLLVSFPRPLIGLLSLVPALAGTSAALFVYSLLHAGISIMVLGFGGALISITVDHGIAYLLFLDRPHETTGREASHEVRAVGIMAVVTTIGAFLILGLSGFPIFTELGQFTALGILFSFLFVHFVFPRIFPTMPPGSGRALPLQNLVDLLYKTGKSGTVMAMLLACGLLFLARPQFHVSLSSMNTVSKETRQADALFAKVWGNIGNRVLFMNTADFIVDLQNSNDRLFAQIKQDMNNEILTASFVPAMIFPGRELAAQNLAAWHAFWDPARTGAVGKTLRAAGSKFGFVPGAFTDFLSRLDPACVLSPPVIPARYYKLLGISTNADRPGLVQFITLQPGNNYDGPTFFKRYSKDYKIFDGRYFSERLAEILFSTFSTMLILLALSLVLLLFFFYLNLTLTVLTLLPVIFAYICTLGTLRLLHHPLDIPGLMLSIIILGMGIDYSILCVRAHQRYRDVSHPSYGLVRSAVFLAGSSTLIGFGVLCFAEHSLLRSIGITSLLGIGYSLLGAFLLLPPLLNMYFSDTGRLTEKEKKSAKNIHQRVRDRYRTLEAYPRMFARFKLQFDPMFDDLPGMLDHAEHTDTIVDIGCGYGVPACWCLEYFKTSKIYGLDPDPERVRVAALATGNRGCISRGLAPELPATPGPADIILILDMLHYLDDETAQTLFMNSRQALGAGGTIVARFVIRPEGKPSWLWRLEDTRIQLSGHTAYYRPAQEMRTLMEKSGFTVLVDETSATNRELVWIVGRRE
jgi:predicted exporter/SAM-dependent methyltransferase